MAHRRLVGEIVTAVKGLRRFLFAGDWTPVEIYSVPQIPKINDPHPSGELQAWRCVSFKATPLDDNRWQADFIYEREEDMAETKDRGSRKYIRVIDVWPQIQELLNLPELAIGGGVTIHLLPGDDVRVDMLGVLPKNAGEVNVTTLADEYTVSESNANQT